jgi:hypothetical protein
MTSVSRFDSARLLVFVLVTSLSTSLGCLGSTTREEERAALGDTDHHVLVDGRWEEPGPLHRPGQPCLVCHSGAHPAEGTSFEVAGTIYERATDRYGVAGVLVTLEDAEGSYAQVVTNRTGSFMVVREGDDDESDESDEGMVSARRAFVPPLRVTLERDGVERPMRSFVWREGSCASCHQADEAVDSPGRIVLEDSP